MDHRPDAAHLCGRTSPFIAEMDFPILKLNKGQKVGTKSCYGPSNNRTNCGFENGIELRRRWSAQDMSSAFYTSLARSSLLRKFRSAFADATGLSLKIVSADRYQNHNASARKVRPFCNLIAHNPSACAACSEVHTELARRLGRKLAPQQTECFAGFSELAVPILVAGEHVATLVGGQVFVGKPSVRQFRSVQTDLRRWGMSRQLRKLERLYFQTPVVSVKQFKGAVRLLALIADSLSELAHRLLLAARRTEPSAVTRARHYVQANLREPLRLDDAASHVELSRAHFCHVFKNTTGMTFTEFVARARVEKTKELLKRPQVRITDVADLAGFNSISQFNRIFRRYAGLSPRAYRNSLQRACRPGSESLRRKSDGLRSEFSGRL